MGSEQVKNPTFKIIVVGGNKQLLENIFTKNNK